MTYISVTEFLSRFPEYHQILEYQKWSIENVGHSYDYDESVSYHNLYAFHGVFMELFMRKCLCQKFGQPCRDDRTEKVLQHKQFRDGFVYGELYNAYAAYKDPHCSALKITEAIKIVALSQRLTHGEHMEDFSDILSMEVDMNNLKEVARFVNKMPYQQLVYKEPCDLYFDNDIILRGVPDYIFDGKVFCQIATSMYEQMPMDKFAQVVFYIMGHYGRYGYGVGAVKEFTIHIYNPLLGLTYTTRWRLTPKEFERIMDCVENSMHKLIDEWF